MPTSDTPTPPNQANSVHRSNEELQAQLATIARSPADNGVVELIVARPAVGERQVLERGELNTDTGLEGDCWKTRGSSSTDDGLAHPLAQLTLMNSRVIEALTGDRAQWPTAGDQIYVDMDLGVENLPAGTRLALGAAEIEISTKPHTGCAKFSERFGPEALRFVNIGAGRDGRFRGVNAVVVKDGAVATGDRLRRL
jgi:hypothetical protein